MGALLASTVAPAGAAPIEAEKSLPTLPPLPPGAPHFAPKAKRVIFLSMAGGPSQLDLFDHKPLLVARNGEPIPEEVVRGERFAFIRGAPKLIGSPYSFSRHGESGAEISELLPHLATVVDDLAIVRSFQTSQFNHGPGQIFMSTGHQVVGRPSIGAWIEYALGTENPNLPGFAVMLSGTSQPDGGKSCWGSGFLPSQHQGVEVGGIGGSLAYLKNPKGVDRQTRRRFIDVVNDLNRRRLDEVGDPEIHTRMEAYELAFRMQKSMPELLNLRSESPATLARYGAKLGERSFANNCLMARRMVERGVRFVHLFHHGWDHHGNFPEADLINGLSRLCRETDRASAALIADLRQRGLLDETLVVWAGEFGRTPMNEERSGTKLPGRDHHPRAGAVWLAGGGIRGGAAVGRTDDFGYDVVEDPVHVHDLNATILHLLGLDHTRLTYEFMGRNFRLTDVFGHVVGKLLT